MKKVTIVAVLVALLGVPVQVRAADEKKVAGGLLLLSGGVLMASAFNYHQTCESGFDSYYVEDTNYCIGRSGVHQAPTSANLKRPILLKVGVGTAAAGTVVLLLPKRARKVAPSISFAPSGWLVSKTVAIGR